MNEPSSVCCWSRVSGPGLTDFVGQFCNYPCTDPFEQAQQQDLPPARTTSPPDPNAPIFDQQPPSSRRNVKRVDHSGEDVQAPPYAIANFAGTGALSDKTAYVSATTWTFVIMVDL